MSLLCFSRYLCVAYTMNMRYFDENSLIKSINIDVDKSKKKYQKTNINRNLHERTRFHSAHTSPRMSYIVTDSHRCYRVYFFVCMCHLRRIDCTLCVVLFIKADIQIILNVEQKSAVSESHLVCLHGKAFCYR